MIELLCGDVRLEEERDGVMVEKGHLLRVDGRCVHHTPELWDAAVLSIPPGRYLGLLGGEGWYVHTWAPLGYESEVARQRRRQVDGSGKFYPVIQKETKADKSRIYSPEVWTGSGEPVGPVLYERVVDEGRKPHPAPLSVSHSPCRPECRVTPTPVLTMAQRANERGWRTLTQHAVGNGMHGGHGGVLAVRDSWAVRMHHDGQQVSAVAVYVKGWGSMWVWGEGINHTKVTSVDRMTQWLAGIAACQAMREELG